MQVKVAQDIKGSTKVVNGVIGDGEGAEGKLTGHRHRPPRPLQSGEIYMIFLRHPWLPKNKGREINKWLTDRDHSPHHPCIVMWGTKAEGNGR